MPEATPDHVGRAGDQPASTRIVRSPGLLVAPFAEGAAIFDPATETTHLVNALGAWLVGSDAPADAGELVTALVDHAGLDASTAHRQVDEAVATLTGLGLLGGGAAPPVPEPWMPSLTVPEPGWHVGSGHAIPGGTLAFCGPDADLIAAVDRAWGTAGDGAAPTILFGLVPDGSGGIDLVDATRWKFPSLDQLLWQLPAVVNDAVAHLDHMVVLHAGAVRTPRGELVVVTGPINTGKSTLVAALVAAGCDYLGDESIGIDGATGHLWAYPKPLTLDPSAQELLGLVPVGAAYTPQEHRQPHDLRVEVVALAGRIGPVDLVVHTAYLPQATPDAFRLSPPQALELLLTNTLNLVRAGDVGLATLCRLAETVPVVSITHDDTFALAEEIVVADADPDALAAAPVPEDVAAFLGAHRWWRDWRGVQVTPAPGLHVAATGTDHLAVVPGRSAVVLDAAQTAICTAAPGAATLVEVDLPGAPDQADAQARRLALVEAAHVLGTAGLVDLDRTPELPLSVVERTVSWSGANRRVPCAPLERLPPRGRPSAGARSGEPPLATLSVDGPTGPVSVGIGGDAPALRRWLAALPEAVTGPAGAATAADVRVLGLPGRDDAVVRAADVTWGPVPPDRLGAAVCRAVALVAGLRPPRAVHLGAAWVRPGEDGATLEPQPGPFDADQGDLDAAVWIGEDGATLWVFDAAGAARRLHGSGAAGFAATDELWIRQSLDRIVVDGPLDDDPARIAACVDLFRADGDDDLDAAVAVATRLVADARVQARSPSEPPAEPDPPAPVAALAAFGALRNPMRSAKLRRAGLEDRRMTWAWTLDPGGDPDLTVDPGRRSALAEAIATFVPGDEVAAALIDLAELTGRFVVGVDQLDDGATARHKVYVELDDLATWHALEATFPAVSALHAGSVLSRDHTVTVPPRFVTFKQVGTSPQRVLSVYRRQHDTGISVADAITAVLPEGSDWIEPVAALIGPDRPLDGPLEDFDLEVIEESGRRSIDLLVPAPIPRAGRAPVAHWLAALAGVESTDATRWVHTVTRHALQRLIVGTDATGAPFVSVYHP